MNKILKGIVAIIIFFLVNIYIMQFIGQFIFFPKDNAMMSYHLFTYTGLMLLSGIIIVCTCVIVEKINNLNDMTKNEYNCKKNNK